MFADLTDVQFSLTSLAGLEHPPPLLPHSAIPRKVSAHIKHIKVLSPLHFPVSALYSLLLRTSLIENVSRTPPKNFTSCPSSPLPAIISWDQLTTVSAQTVSCHKHIGRGGRVYIMPYNTHFSRIYVSYFHLLAKFFICFYAALIRSLEMQHVSPFALAAGLIPIPLPLSLASQDVPVGGVAVGEWGALLPWVGVRA